MYLKRIIIFSTLVCLSMPLLHGQGITIHTGSQMVLSGNAAIVVKDGNFINNGSFISGTLYMKGSAASSSAKIGGTSTTDFQNLTIDKSSNGVELNSPISLFGNLTMTNGDLNLKGKTIALFADALIQNETESNRIWGDSGQIVKAALLNAPNNVNLGNMGLTFNSSDNLGVVTVRRIHSTATINGSPAVQRQYKLAYFNSGFTVDYQMQYYDSELNGLTESNLSPFSNHGTWNQQTADSINTTLNMVYLSNLNETDTLFAFGLGGILLSAKTLLQGNYVVANSLMSDDLRSNGLIPLAEPYGELGFTHVGDGGGETIDTSVLLVTGNNAIVDWILLELRDKNNAATVQSTKSVLLQRDGDIVGLDGVLPVIFTGIGADDYFITIRHRNHIGVRTPAVQALSSNSTTYDFTTAVTQANGTHPMAELTTGIYGLWAGDANGDGKVYANANPSDAQLVSGAVLTHPGNVGIFGSGPVTNYTGFIDVYDSRDINLDGKIFDNANPSDAQLVSGAVLTHPGNVGIFGSGPVTNYTGLTEQIDP